MIPSLLLAAIAVLPADRLAMGDRLFNKGQIAEAEAEYASLTNEASIAADELLYRLAECDRALARNDSARARYAALYSKYPESKHAERARLMHAMGLTGVERRQELAALDSDRVSASTRAAALYTLGVELSDVDMLERCVKVEPKGRYADYAQLRQATLLTGSKESAERRKGIGLLLGIAFGNKGELSEEALYLAAVQSYRDKNYGEAGSLFRRYQKLFPKGARLDDVRLMAAWSDYMSGRYADAAAACGDRKGDDYAYIRAASAYAQGDDARAETLLRAYLADYPDGKYRADAELPLARIEFKQAEKRGDGAMVVESARRGYALSKQASDAVRLAWAYEKAGRQEEALSEYARVAREYAGTEAAADALYRKAMLDAREERWAATELGLAEALATGKCGARQGSALCWRGIAAIHIGHEQEGVGFLREALKAGLALDESREARLLVADFDMRNDRVDEARAIYEKLIDEGACDRMSAMRILAVGKLLGGERAKTCARALVAGEAPEWRQAGWALLGDCEEKAGAFTAAIEAYRKCLAEKANVADAAQAALHLGILETRSGAFDLAEVTLKKAVALNGGDVAARGQAYLALARNSELKKDFQTARAYATVVMSLFEDEKLCAEAKRIVDAHPEEDE